MMFDHGVPVLRYFCNLNALALLKCFNRCIGDFEEVRVVICPRAG